MRPVAMLVPPVLAIVLAACGGSGVASTPPQATAGASAVPAAAAGADPTCEQVLTPAELASISTVDGWALTSSDDAMPDTDVTCQWDFKADTPEWLHAEVHVWSDPQAAGYLDGGLPGDPVSGLGDAAAWSEVGGRLLVQLGDRVLGVVPGSWLGPDGPEAAAVAVAGLVVPRIPR